MISRGTLEREHMNILRREVCSRMPFHTVDVSGIHGAYELGCQALLWEAYTRIRENKLEFENKEELDDWLIKQDFTDRIHPSMLQAGSVMNHLLHILKMGYIEWILKHFRCERDRVYLMDWKLIRVFEDYYIK